MIFAFVNLSTFQDQDVDHYHTRIWLAEVNETLVAEESRLQLEKLGMQSSVKVYAPPCFLFWFRLAFAFFYKWQAWHELPKWAPSILDHRNASPNSQSIRYRTLDHLPWRGQSWNHESIVNNCLNPHIIRKLTNPTPTWAYASRTRTYAAYVLEMAYQQQSKLSTIYNLFRIPQFIHSCISNMLMLNTMNTIPLNS